jgi:hypothetical protein
MFSVAAPVRLESWSWGCDQNQLKKVLEILKILKGQASVGLNSVMIRQTRVERRVQPLKLRVHLL